MCTLVRVLMTVIGGFLLFSEKFTVLNAVGGLLLLFSIALVIWSKEREKARQNEEKLLLLAKSPSQCT